MPPDLQYVPAWVPPRVADEAETLRLAMIEEGAPPQHLAMLERLQTDARMQTVWDTLKRRKRDRGTPTGVREFEFPPDRDALKLFLNLPKPGDYIVAWELDRLSADDVQDLALAVLLHMTMNAIRLDLRPITRTQLEERRSRYETAACALDWDGAPPYDRAVAAQLRQYAAQLEGACARLDPNDPLLVDRHRGDKRSRGLRSVVEHDLTILFGLSMRGLAATIVAVALGR